MTPRLALPLALAALALGACTTTGSQQSASTAPTPVAAVAKTAAELTLAAGIKDYEDGNYPSAIKRINEALSQGLAQKADQVQAHKYLAFMACATNKKAECSSEFRAALTIDPEFELSKAERGHPQWGPVFIAVQHLMSRGN